MHNKISRNCISLAGEFGVLSQLAMRGIDANLTLGNTKGVDILASNPENGRLFRIEVKTTLSKPAVKSMWGQHLSWQLQSKHDNLADKNLFFVFVQINPLNKDFRYFIVPSIKVGRYCYEQHQYWLAYRKNITGDNRSDNDLRTFRLGTDNNFDYKIDTLLAKDYEDKWNFSD